MTISDEYTAIYWVAFGLFCILLEASAVSGIGFLFAGLSACAIAVMIQSGLIEHGDYIWQFIWFLGLTAFWAAVLWKPFKKFQNRSEATGYKNIHGDMVTVKTAPKDAKSSFDVSWSGTTVKARLENGDNFPVQEGDSLEVIRVEGNTFWVKSH